MPPTNTTNLPFIPVTIHQMQQNVITKKTYNGYKYNIWALLMHGYSNRNEGWLTTHARRSISSILSQVERTQGASQKGKVKWDGLYIMLSEAKESPIIHIDRFTPEIYMTFLQGQRNLDGSFLKPSNYTGRSSSLRHLFRCHPDLEGYPPGFEERLKTLSEIRRYGLGGPVPTQPATDQRATTGNAAVGYTLHFYNGKYHRVPQGWRLPTGTAKSLWVAFNCGDTVNNVPPLRILTAADVKHLDDLPLPQGKKCRKGRQTLCDINTLCKYIEGLATEIDVFRHAMSRNAAGECFDKVATVANGLLSSNRRSAQISWQTILKAVRKVLKAQRAAQSTENSGN